MRVLLLAALLAMISAPVLAQPVISGASGTLAPGEVYYITGHDFGVKDPAPPLIWENFNSGTPETRLDSLGEIEGTLDTQWSVGTDNDRGWDEPSYCDWDYQLRTPGNVARFVYPVHQVSNGLRDICYTDDLPGGYGGKIFVMLWCKHNYAEVAVQWKRWMVSDGPIDVETYPTIGPHFDQTGNRIRSFTASMDIPGGYDDDCADQQHYYQAFRDTSMWHCDELVAQYNSAPSVCDAYCNFWGDFEKIVDHDEGSNWLLSESGHTDSGFKQFRFGRYVKLTPREVHAYYDDVYIDNSWARIYLGNAPNFENCTHREIQIPVMWGTGAASFTVNAGTFLPGEDVYAFLVDENNVPSQGYPITMGGSYGRLGPAGGFVINNDAEQTDNEDVILNISVIRATEMRFSNNGGMNFPEGWVPFSTTYAWTLDASASSQVVMGEFRDDVDNLLTHVTDSVVLTPGQPGAPSRIVH